METFRLDEDMKETRITICDDLPIESSANYGIDPEPLKETTVSQIPIPIIDRNHSEARQILSDVSQMSPPKSNGTSPPTGLIWTWGGLPTKQEVPKRVVPAEGAISHQISAPQLNNNFKNDSLSNSEKVERYLETINVGKGSAQCPDYAPILAKAEETIPEGAHVEISLSGPLRELSLISQDDAMIRFRKYQVNYDQLCDDPVLLMDPLTVYKFDGLFHSWTTAAPCILSQVAFGKKLSEKAISFMIPAQTPASGGYSFIKGWWGTSKLQNKSVARAASALPLTHNRSLSPQGLHDISSRNTNASTSPIKRPLSAPPVSEKLTGKSNYAKSLRLTSDQLKSLNLKNGVNQVEFSVNSALQGRQTCKARIFLWNFDAKIVISDVDGTITK